MKTKRNPPSREALREFALNVCLVLAAILAVVGVAKIYAPAGFIAAACAVAGAGWWFFTGGDDESSEESPR